MIERLFDLALWLAGIGHFVVLIASVQVPKRFGWKADFAKLTPFNRKLVWIYSTYTFGTILAFGVLLLALHDELMRGDRAALWLAGFIGVFWAGRIGIDAVVFSHSDWPQGRLFVAGHALLTSLFACIVGTLFGLIAWHAWLR